MKQRIGKYLARSYYALIGLFTLYCFALAIGKVTADPALIMGRPDHGVPIIRAASEATAHIGQQCGHFTTPSRWASPPSGYRITRGYGSSHFPSGVSDFDSYRLSDFANMRQCWIPYLGGKTWTARRGLARVVYERENRDIYSNGPAAVITFYWYG